jgi:MSHA biogenesis protein MshM
MSLLYLDHFGLKKPPFKITPDLDFFFSGGRRGDTLSALLHVARHEEGIITVVAEVGSGKTLLSRLMISQLGAQVSTVYLPNPCFSRDEILSAIARDLGLSDLPASTEAKLSALQQELLRRHGLGQRVLLVVDEAHAMPPESLEEIRLLSNLETQSHKLVNIMLFGQPELDAVLADPRLRQVRDRVIHRFELQALPQAEASAYIDHRLRAAGWKGGALFSPAALALLVKAAGGRARRINLLADKALLGAYAEGALQVQAQHVKGALGELHADGPKPAQRGLPAVWKWAAASVVLTSAMTVLAVWQIEQHRTLQVAAPIAVPAPTAPEQPQAPVVTSASNLERPSSPEAPPRQAALAPASAAPNALGSGAALQTTPQGASSERDLQAYFDRTHTLLSKPAGARYTLQLAAIPRDVNGLAYLKFAGQHVDPALLYAQASIYDGRNFVAVYFGTYGTMAQANTALAALPQALKFNKPIIRTWAKIRLDQAP